MAKLTKNISRLSRDGKIAILGVQKDVTVFGGSLLELDASGHVAPATKAAAKLYPGVATHPAKGGAAGGDVSVHVDRGPVFHFAWGGTANKDIVGTTVYALDDNTVTELADGASKLGSIIDVDDNGVWVDISRVSV